MFGEMIKLILILIIQIYRGVSGAGFYLLDGNQQETTAGYGLLMYNRGTVCDDAFNDITADWICRMMGFVSLISWSNGRKYSWQENYSIKLDDVVCTGNVLPKCTYLTSDNCGHSEDVWLHCNTREQLGNENYFYQLDNDGDVTQSGNGLLMYKGGTVCDDGFTDTAAKWICQLMGFETFVGWDHGRRTSFQDSLPIKLDNLACSSGAFSDILPHCSCDSDTSEDFHNEDVWIWCSSPLVSECPAGHRFINGKCEKCPPSTYYPTPNGRSSCLPCPANSTSTAGSFHCTCEGGYYINAGLDKCHQCPPNTVSREGSSSLNHCVPCPIGSDPVGDGKGCSCRAGHGWFWTSSVEGTCSPCPVNFYKHKMKGVCQKCPVGATSSFLSEECMCSVGLSWDGEKCVNCQTKDSESGVCGCKAGTFWKDYTRSCFPCPANSNSTAGSIHCTCEGGYYLNAGFDKCLQCPPNTVSRQGSRSLNQCVYCPIGSDPVDNGKSCSCRAGHGWIWTSSVEGTCSPCPVNFFKHKMKGVCQKCPAGATSSFLSEDCLCPLGLSWDGEKCVNCQTEDSVSGVCGCKAGTFWNGYTRSCLPCPANSNSTAGSTHCSCEGGHYLSARYDTCLQCPPNTVSRQGSRTLDQCVSCPIGSVPVDNGKVCSCRTGHGWFWTSSVEGTCSPCPVNFYKHKMKGVCQKCPAGATSSFLSEECMCSVGLSWDGDECVNCQTEDSVSGVCGCKAGTFWNSSTSKCVRCPESHYSGDHSQSCIKCPTYTVASASSAKCESCPAGHYWEEFSCNKCPEQHIAKKNTCFKCPEGTFLSEDKTTCKTTTSIDFLLITNLAISIILLLLMLALFIRKKLKFSTNIRADPNLVYRNDQAALDISDYPCAENIRDGPPQGLDTQEAIYDNLELERRGQRMR
ncbi:hypothetical protein ACHWQZ_G003598 [Mnemiopsis leidyi]